MSVHERNWPEQKDIIFSARLFGQTNLHHNKSVMLSEEGASRSEDHPQSKHPYLTAAPCVGACSFQMDSFSLATSLRL